jgi:P27 family predicted phage terminase small subunit
MAGRRPKPTALKIAEGNLGKRALNHNEPQFGGLPKCPAHLDKDAKAEWRRISKELAAVGLLAAVDRAALSAYCQCWSRWCDAEQNIQKIGTVVKSPKSGYPIQNPYVGIANTALDQMRKFLIEFGLTPASRSRISLDLSSGNKDDSFDAFMANRPVIEGEAEDSNPNECSPEKEQG